jgi:hypothetical protein
MFPIGSNVKLGLAVATILDFISEQKTKTLDPKPTMAATAGHRLTLDPMGKCSNMNIMRYGVNVNETTTPKSNCIRNAFFSETIYQTHSKLHRNVYWIVLYKV